MSINFLKKLGLKLAAVTIVIALVFSLVGCDSKKSDTAEESKTSDKVNSDYSFLSVYDSFLNREPVATDTTMSVELSDDAIDLIQQYVFGSSDADVDLDWINSTKINFYTNQDGDRAETSIGLILDNEEFANAYIMADMEEGMAYIKLDGLTDDVLGIDLEEMYSEMDIDADLEQIQQMKDMLYDILPKPEVLELLLNRYIQAIIEGIESETYSETVEVEGIKQELSVTKIPVTQKQLVNMFLPVLKIAKDDDDLKEIIENAVDTLIEYGIITEDDIGGDVYEMFCKELEAAIEEIEENADEIDDHELCTIKLYTDDDDNISGLEVSSEGSVAFRWVDVQDGDEVASEISAPALTPQSGFTGLRGLGAVDGDTLDITYEVIVTDTALCEIDISDYDIEKAKSGQINATVRIEPTDDLYDFLEDEVGFEGTDVISVLSPYVEFVISSDDDEAEFSVSVGSRDNNLIKITVNTEISNSKSIGGMSADFDISEAEEWAQTIDLEDLEERLLDTEFGQFIMLLNTAVKTPALEYEDVYTESVYY